MARETTAYTITTGFYPEIAAGEHSVKSKKGKGRVMQKFAKVKGFSPTSVQRQKMLSLKNALMYAGGAQMGMPLNPMARAAILGQTGGFQYSPTGGPTGKQQGTAMFAPFGASKGLRDKFTYIGGTEEYKLYGDQVWYMYASRQRGDLISDYLTRAGKTGPQFQNIFSKAKPQLVVEAVALAKRVFDQSWDVAKIEENLKDAGEMSAEEIGFTVGEFRYMSVGRAVRDEHINKQYAETSEANDRDMVKLDAAGKVVASYDVTEQLITQVGQHGITEAPSKELVKIIKSVNPKDDEQMEDLRQGVIKMFVKQAIVYNKHIKHLKKTLTPKGTAQKRVTWDSMLKKSIASDKKQEKKKRAGLKEIAKYTVGMPQLNTVTGKWSSMKDPVQIRHYHHMETQDKTMEQTSLEHIAHMLGTLTEEMNENFSQTHKVKQLGPEESIYAIVPMKTFIGGNDNLLFDASKEGVIAGTALTIGANATTAIAAAVGELTRDGAIAAVQAQNHQYMVAKSNKSGGHRVRGMTYSGISKSLRNKGLRPTTNVSIPAGPKLKAMLIGLLEGVIPDLSKLDSEMSQLRANTLGLVMNQRGEATNKFSKTEKNTMFWALPYIGVLQSEYADKKKK
jgi:hypothetical protein